ncbi:MAG: NMD protein affecting ribosome stability and mRNA decay [Candidatus Syntrophoarchaeum caldarius]|uniref:NMD protein affecting ribosome stability and mRNA decay n=1 Tax=Candidatus Syntropharchaeum caldarium TaxID=1838285 RepID=A0A1F2PAN2_9EURY|nr:MAG: NMD protein affecting ribosome stability and mRNA decay [Candidatus Syntrophoarchaeum caldarius]
MKGVTDLKFCPNCGADVEELIDGVCRNCFTRAFSPIEEIQRVEIRFCPNCGAHYCHGRWVYGDLTTSIREEILKTVKISALLDEFELSLDCEIGDAPVGLIPARLHISGRICDQPFEKEQDIEVKIIRESCTRCSRIAGGYYEATVQIRAKDRIPTDEEIDACLRILDDRIAHHDSFVTKLRDVKTGVDIYVGDQGAAQDGAKEIIKQFGGKSITSPKLVGKRNGKNIYRLTIVVRLPGLVVGDIAYHMGKIMLITSIAKHAGGIYLEDGTQAGKIDLSELKFCMKASEAKEAVLLMVYEKEVEILDPETFRAVTIKKPLFLTEGAGEEVRIVKIDDRVFLVPGMSR